MANWIFQTEGKSDTFWCIPLSFSGTFLIPVLEHYELIAKSNLWCEDAVSVNKSLRFGCVPSVRKWLFIHWGWIEYLAAVVSGRKRPPVTQMLICASSYFKLCREEDESLQKKYIYILFSQAQLQYKVNNQQTTHIKRLAWLGLHCTSHLPGVCYLCWI